MFDVPEGVDPVGDYIAVLARQARHGPIPLDEHAPDVERQCLGGVPLSLHRRALMLPFWRPSVWES